MITPIVDFVKKYSLSNNLRLHMPGHKGNNFIGVENLDITEIDGADVLYSAQGIIQQSEDNAAKLFGTQKTIYSTEGSSLAIRAMLYLLKLYSSQNGKKPLIAAGRNAHKTFVTACALLDIDVDWLLPQDSENVISCKITADFLEDFIIKSQQKPDAVYITSPDYLGCVTDIAAVSEVCKKYGILLLVDNAHGAYLRFLPNDCHPITLGADMCCDSAHKTFPVLTGGAYLHISNNAPKMFAQKAQTAMSMFASTSPSYLILQSLDMANLYMCNGYTERLGEFIKAVAELKTKLVEKGFCFVGDEPLKLTIAPKSYGYTGYEIANLLSQEQIICEFSDLDYIVMMLTPETEVAGLKKIQKALSGLERKTPITITPPKTALCQKILSLAKAIYLPSQELEIEECLGKVLATPSVVCPPAIPIVVCGEKIDEIAIKCFKYYGINKCFVVDEAHL